MADAHVYADDAISGADTRKLVSRQRLLDLALSGRPPFHVVIMRDDSRFSREDGDKAFGELKRLAQCGVEIWFYQDGKRFTFGTFSDNVVGFVRAEMNAEYRRQIARFTFEAMVRKFRAGHVVGGVVFGYTDRRTHRTANQRDRSRRHSTHFRPLDIGLGVHAHRENAQRGRRTTAGAPSEAHRRATRRLESIDRV